MASHWPLKSGKGASAAEFGTSGPHWPRNWRISASCLRSRSWSGIHVLSWKAPFDTDRILWTQDAIWSEVIINTPHAPMPPLFAKAIDKEGGVAPAIGASRIGDWRSNYFVKVLLRSNAALALNIRCVLGLNKLNKPNYGCSSKFSNKFQLNQFDLIVAKSSEYRRQSWVCITRRACAVWAANPLKFCRISVKLAPD